MRLSLGFSSVQWEEEKNDSSLPAQRLSGLGVAVWNLSSMVPGIR